MLIFLNFNGVLHPNAVVLFAGKPIVQAPYESEFEVCEWGSILESMLIEIDPNEQIKIVLTTNWAHQLGWEKAAEYLPDSLKKRVIGSTNGDLARYSIMNGFRLIEDFLNNHHCNVWLAIDDDSYGWSGELRQHLVMTEGALGLNTAKAQIELKAKLVNMINSVEQ